MTAVKTPDLEPMPGYRLVEPLGKGGFGEVWKCEVPGGLCKALKFVASPDTCGLHAHHGAAEQELRCFNLIKTIRHPFILSLDRVELVDDELVIVMELADRSLHDVLLSWQKAGQPGVPRGDLLRYLRETAEALDVLNLEYGLQHLDIKPRNLFLVHDHVKIGDFGLVSSLADLCNGTLNLASLTPLYTAPEAFVGKITLFTDQYSLAIAYCELLSGQFPFDGQNYRQLALQHSTEPPNLEGLPDADRAIVRRALAKDPRQRFPSSMEFVQELLKIPSPPVPQRLSRRLPTAPKQTQAIRPALGDTIPLTKPTQRAEPIAALKATPLLTPVISPSSKMSRTLASGEGYLPGYRLHDCLGRTPMGETWKAHVATGGYCLIKLVSGFDPATADRPNSPLQRLRSLDHPVLAPNEFVVTKNNQLAVIGDLVEATLSERLREHQQHGKPGIPRRELLGYLQEVAECLDELAQTEKLHHLMLSPRQLALIDDEVFILDFGLAELIWLPAGIQPAAVNSRYGAPELFVCQPAPTSDQYALALIYQELLTGVHPFPNLNPRQRAAQKGVRPDMSLVPASDRPALLQALSIDPDRRFDSCSEFIQALIMAVPDQRPVPGRRSQESAKIEAAANSTALRQSRVTPNQLNKVLAEVVAQARGEVQIRSDGTTRYLLRPGPVLEHRCHAILLPTALKLQLHGFRQQWGGKVIASGAHSHTLRVYARGSMWKRMIGLGASYEIDIRFAQPETNGPALTPVTIEIKTAGVAPAEAKAQLEQTGPLLLKSLRHYLQAQPERRREERLPFNQTLNVSAVFGNGTTGPAIAAQAINVSTGGLRLQLPYAPQSTDLLIELAAPGSAESIVLPARVVRAEGSADGTYDVGVCFRV